MEFHSLPRRQLQALCKQHKIPANLTNVAMATALDELYKKSNADGQPLIVDLTTPVKPGVSDSAATTPVLNGRLTRSQARKLGKESETSEAASKSIRRPPTAVSTATKKKAGASLADTTSKKLFVDEEASDVSEVTVSRSNKPRSTRSRAQRSRPLDEESSSNVTDAACPPNGQEEGESKMVEPEEPRQPELEASPCPVVKVLPATVAASAAPVVELSPAKGVEVRPAPVVEVPPAKGVEFLPEIVAASAAQVVEVPPAPVVEVPPAKGVEFPPETVAASGAQVVEVPPPVVEVPAAKGVEFLPATVVAPSVPLVEVPSATVAEVPSAEVSPAPVVEVPSGQTETQLVEVCPAPVIKVSPARVVEVCPQPVVEISPAPILPPVFESAEGVESGVSVIGGREDSERKDSTPDEPAPDFPDQGGAAADQYVPEPAPTGAEGEDPTQVMAEFDLVAEAALCKQDDESSIPCWFDNQISTCEGFGNLLRQIREVVETDEPMAAVDPSSGWTDNQVEILPTGDDMCVEDFVQDVLVDVVPGEAEDNVVTTPEDEGVGLGDNAVLDETAGAFARDDSVAQVEELDEKDETMTEVENAIAEVVRAADEMEPDGSATSDDVGMTEEAGGYTEEQPKAEDTGVIKLVEPTKNVVEQLSEALADVKLSEEPNACRRRRRRPSSGKENLAVFEGVSLRKLRVMYKGLVQTKQSRPKDVKPLSSNLQKNNQAKCGKSSADASGIC